MRQRNLWLTAGFLLPAGLIAVALNLFRIDENPATNARWQTSPSQQRENPVELTTSAADDDPAATNRGNAESVKVRASPWTLSAEARQSGNTSYRTSDMATPRNDSSNAREFANQTVSEPSDGAANYSEPHIPFVFLDYSAVVPATEEAAAAVQKIQQDFIRNTGAATADPEDPNFAALWTQFQPTADEVFCAIFGTEACNALSIQEAHQRGHF